MSKPIQITSSAPTMPSMRVSISVALRKPPDRRRPSLRAGARLSQRAVMHRSRSVVCAAGASAAFAA